MSASLPDGTAFYVAIQAYNDVGKSGYSNIEYFVITSTDFTIMTNPTDSEILSATGSDGTTIHYYGDRDDDGIPTNIDRFDVVDTDGTSTMIQLDSESRPKRMRTSDGFVFELDYIGNNQAAVQVLSPDGSAQINTSFVIGTDTDGALNVDPMAGIHATGKFSDCYINVEHCGAAITDADVRVKITQAGNLTPSWFGPAAHVTGGTYYISLPTSLPESLNGESLRKAAEAIAAKLGNICTVLSAKGNPEHYLTLMCPAIGMALTTFTGPIAIMVGAACAKVTAAVTVYCALLGNGGLPGNSSLAEQILKGLQDPSVLTGEITIEASAIEPGAIASSLQKVSTTVTASPAGPFPTINISGAVNSRIGGFTISPASPLALKPYEITTQIVCPNPGDSLAIDVARFDDRGDPSVEYQLVGMTLLGGTISITGKVPGGGGFGAAMDIVTATITDSYGDIIDSGSAIITIPKAEPIIDGISPKAGLVDTMVTITGTNFGKEPGRFYFYNNISATVISWTAIEIKTRVPAGAISGDVKVYDRYGIASNGVYFEVKSSTPGWDGGCSKTPCSSLYFKRPTSKGGPHGDYSCPYQAVINAECWADINPSSSPRSLDEIYKTLQDDSHKLTSIEKIQIGILTGWFGESELTYNKGYYDGGYVSSGISSYGRGWVINEEGDFAVRLIYNVGGYGCFNNTQKDFMETEGKAAKTEAQAIMKSIRLLENGDLGF